MNFFATFWLAISSELIATSHSNMVSYKAKCKHNQLVCGDDKCCCDNPTYIHNHMQAVCRGWKSKLPYIPKFPHSVTELQFNGNSLQSLTKHTFANISAEKYSFLTLIDNDIRNVSDRALTDFQVLTYLDVSDNPNINISQLRSSLRKPTALRSLHMNNISISDIGDDFFSGMHVDKIKYIYLGRNSFKILNMKALQNFRKLKKIKSTDGEITGVSEVTRNVTFTHLSQFYLRNNNIHPYQPNFCSKQRFAFPYLKEINLSYNNIQRLIHRHWSCLPSLQKIILSGNEILVIQSNTFSVFPKLSNLTIANMKGKVKSIQKHAFNSSSLERLSLSSNTYDFHNVESQDIFKSLPNIKMLDISSNNMFQLTTPYMLETFTPVKSVTTLIMQSVQLRTLPSEFLRIFSNLSTFIAIGNLIHNIDSSFRFVSTLKYISIDSNRISVIKERAFSTELLQTLEKLNIGNNPFDCTCELFWFRHWIDQVVATKQLMLMGWPKSYHCVTPSSFVGKRLIHFLPTKIYCATTMIILCTVIPGCVIIIFSLNILLYRRRWHIVYYFYKLRRNRNANKNEERRSLLEEHDSVYDGYVIYHDEDREFVHTHLKEIVEDKHHLRLHIWHRDAGLGSKMEVMFDAIHASRNVLVVVSNHFLNDSYCHFQLEIALDKSTALEKKNVSLILLDTIELKTLSKYWCVLFTKTPTLEWAGSENDVKKRVFEQELVDHLTK